MKSVYKISLYVKINYVALSKWVDIERGHFDEHFLRTETKLLMQSVVPKNISLPYKSIFYKKEHRAICKNIFAKFPLQIRKHPVKLYSVQR